MPVADPSARPVGSVPLETLHFTVPTPPCAASGRAYAVPVTARGRAASVRIATGRTATMTNDLALLSVPDLAVTVNSKRPSFVGWPLTTPVPAARASPDGRVPFVTAQVIDSAPPVATSLSSYGSPTMARGRSAVEPRTTGIANVAPTA